MGRCDASVMSELRQPEVESWEIHSEEQIRLETEDLRFGFLEVSPNLENVAGDFPKSHERHFTEMFQHGNACSRDGFAAPGSDFQIGGGLQQMLDDSGRIHVPRCFPGNHQDTPGGHAKMDWVWSQRMAKTLKIITSMTPRAKRNQFS